MSLMPPLRFGVVDVGIYRSAYPVLENHRFLRRLQLKTVICLVPELPIHDLTSFCGEPGTPNAVNIIHIPLMRTASLNAALQSQILRALQILTNPDNHPVLIHCLDGRRITGLVVACFRIRVLSWCASYSIAEFWRYHMYWRSESVSSQDVEKGTREIEKFISLDWATPVPAPPANNPSATV